MERTREISSIPLAIIGMGCRLPGADNLEEFWRLIVEGQNAIKEVPADRLNQDLYYDPKKGVRGKTYSKLGAVISNRPLNRRILPVPHDLERSIDVAHARMCEVAAAACRHAGMDPFNLPARNVGVYIGHAQGSRLSGDYTYATCVEEAAQFLLEVDEFRDLPPPKQQEIIAELVKTIRSRLPARSTDSPDMGACMVAGAISKAFGLTGPFMALNSACASSLQTMLLAGRALQLGRVDMAIAGGASDIKGDTLVLFAAAQAMSATGSRPFDAGADGLICAEGYVAVLMKTLEKALADGDPIQAVVRGFGVASDGRGKSLWAPRKEGQIAAMQQAYRNGAEIGNIQYIEAHATATQVGDATELETLNEILKKHVAPGKKIPITSVKANIGHTLEAAGIAGVIKTVLCMQNHTIPPAINIRRLNPKIDWASASIYVPQAPVAWPSPANGQPRTAGVNAFGIGGLNMHVVIEEFNEASKTLIRAERPDAPPSSASLRSSEQEPVAIVGMGCILPGAANVDAFWDMLRTGRDPKSHAPGNRWRADLGYKSGAKEPFKSPTTLGGYITDFQYDWRVHKLPPMQIAQADPLQFMLLEAADQAFKDAGYDKKPFDRTRVGVVVGTEFGGDFAFQLQVALRLPEIGQLLEKLLIARNCSPQSCRSIPAKFADKLIEHWPALIDESGSFTTSSLASRITKTRDLMGGAAAIDCGSASSMSSLFSAVDMLLAGDCNMVVCAAGQRRMNLLAYEALSMTGVLSTEEKPRSPLDAKANGYVPGEGVGVLILKRLADARRDGDRIHAIVRGIGAARHESPGRAIELAIQRSLGTCGVQAGDVTLVETDGSGNALHDDEQLRAIASAYGQIKRRGPLAIGEAISQIGHTGGASGMVSTIKAVEELAHLELPAAVGLEAPGPAIAEAANTVCAALAPSTIKDRTDDGRVLAAVSSSDRGLSFHVLLERGAKVPAPAAPLSMDPLPQPAAQHIPIPASRLAPALVPGSNQGSSHLNNPMTTLKNSNEILPPIKNTLAPNPAPKGRGDVVSEPLNPKHGSADGWRILRLGAGSPEELRGHVRQLQGEAAKAFARAAASQFGPSDRVRLAIVADTPAALSEKLAQCAAALEGGDGKTFAPAPEQAKPVHGNGHSSAGTVMENRGIFLRQPGVTRPRIAFVFPGQASQYVGMLKELIRDVPAACKAMDEANLLMQKHNFQSFAEMAWDAASGAGTDIWVTQCSMLVADTIMLAAMRDRGFRPDIAIGHSYGEYLALQASGAWDLERALLATRARCEAIAASSSGRGSMLATNAPPAIIEQLAQRLDEPVYLANYNAPDQVVVGGGKDAIADLAELLEREGCQGRILAVPCPFHTPLLREAALSFESALKKIRIDRPTAPFVTAVSNRVLSDPEEIRANLVAHMTTPIRFDQMIRAIADEAPTVFVEVGPQQVLTRLVRRILGQDAADAIACDNPKRPGMEQLWHVQALLECTGAWQPVPETAQAASLNASPHRAPAEQSMDDWFFDATARRREKMRKTSGQQQVEPDGLPIPQPILARARPYEAAPLEALEYAGAATNGFSPAPPSHLNGEIGIAANAISSVATVQSPASSKTPGDSELEQFLIHFVVEHTGYPEEVVELDADLEADLGIDSIKKAQLFGELREYFDIKPDANLTLDDFPTLRHVLNYLHGAALETTVAPPREINGETSATETLGPEIDNLDGWQMNSRLSEQSVSGGATAPPMPAPRSVTTAPATELPIDQPDAAPARPAESKKEIDASDLESFLINFVVEHTGYPAEVVELDADLEADLGIDSIKKAQLFGEMREYFDITPDANLTLDDFPTLRHVLKYLQNARSAKSAAQPAESIDALADIETGPVFKPEESASETEPAMEDSAAPRPAPGLAPLRPGGASYEAGLRHGRREKPAIRQILRRYADIAGSRFDDSRIQPETPQDFRTLFTPDQLQELQGIADGAEVAVESIMAYIVLRGGDPVFSPRKSDQSPSRANEAKYEPEESLFNAERQTQRFVMRMIDAPFKDSAPQAPRWHGPALLIGHSTLNASLRQGIEGQGVPVFELAPSGDIEADLGKLTELWNRQPILHVFLTAARDRDESDIYDAEDWNTRCKEKILSPYFLCQRWLQLVGEANLLNQCSIIGITGLGGDFGFSGNVATPEGGAITGLLKGIWMEYTFARGQKEMIVKTVDAPDDEPPDMLAANIIREMAGATMDYEIGFVGGRRRLQNALNRPAEMQPINDIRRGGVWVVTGGARGITARCALELGRRFGLRLHLIGTSPLPQVDPSWQGLSAEGINNLKAKVILKAKESGEPIAKAWERVEKAIEIDRSLTAFAAAGVSAAYHTCDVSDRQALAGVLDAIRRSDGPIEGIVHGAGIERSGRFERKTRTDVRATIESKVDGARNLMELTRDDPVAYFIGFGSVSGRLGSTGQSDYCMASDLLCKLISWYRTGRPNCRAVGLHWHGWDEVGMAAKPEVQAMFKRTNAPKPMPVAEGVRHLLREMFAGIPQSEIMITDWDCYRRFYKDGAEEEFRAGREDSQRAPSAAPSAQVSQAERRPLIESLHKIEGGGHIAEIQFHPLRDVFLADHRMAGKPFLPGVLGMEAIAEAAQLSSPGRTVVAMRDVEIANGLLFHGDDPVKTQVTVMPHEFGVQCRLTGDLRDRKKRLIEANRLITEGIVEFAPQAQLFDAKPPGKPPQGWFPYLYPESNDVIMYHGKSLRCLRECCFQYDGGWGKIVAPPLAQLAGQRASQGWIFPLAALDACVVACCAFVWIQFSGLVAIPHGFRRLFILRQPREGETCIMRFFFRGREENHCLFDFTLFGDDESVILQAERFRTVGVGEGDGA